MAARIADADREIRDVDVRAQLRRDLAIEDGAVEHRIVEEWNIGASRIDVAKINAFSLCGYEIKSPADSLARLVQQSRDYSRVFDTCTLVVGRKHRHAIAAVPDWWGIKEVTRSGIVGASGEGGVMLVDVRDPAINPSPEPHEIAALLWAFELRKLLERYGLISIRRENKQRMREIVCRNVALHELRAFVCRALLDRRQWLGDVIYSPLAFADMG